MILDKIIEFKKNLEYLKNNSPESDKIDKATLCKLLVMANIAEMTIYAGLKIEKNQKEYFEGQAFVGRYYMDWGLDWIPKYYLEICRYIKENHWPV